MRQFLIWISIICLLTTLADARQVYQIGGVKGVSWSDVGTPSFIDEDFAPGSIRPLSTELSHNLISTMRDRGGDITSLVSIYTLPANWPDTRGFAIDGDDLVTGLQAGLCGGATLLNVADGLGRDHVLGLTDAPNHYR